MASPLVPEIAQQNFQVVAGGHSVRSEADSSLDRFTGRPYYINSWSFIVHDSSFLHQSQRVQSEAGGASDKMAWSHRTTQRTQDQLVVRRTFPSSLSAHVIQGSQPALKGK